MSRPFLVVFQNFLSYTLYMLYFSRMFDMIVIKFKSREDKINGYYLLALKGIVRRLRDDLFEINDFMLKSLDKER